MKDIIYKFRQEIKRLRQEIKDEKNHIALNQRVGYLFVLTDMESFLDILSVKPDKNLEEEYKDYIENDPVYSKLVNRNAGLGIARHFAEWQKSQMLKDAIPFYEILKTVPSSERENTRIIVIKDESK